MASKFPGMAAALAACVLAAGCGGGGGGGESTPRHYLFVSNNGATDDEVGVILQAVDPDHPEALVSIEPSGSTILNPTLLTVGRWGGTEGRIRNAYTRAIVYWKNRGDGELQLYRAEGRVTDTDPVPVQISNLHVASVDQVCDLKVLPDYSDPESSLVVALWAAAPDTCATAGGVKTSVVKLSAGSTVSPPTFSQSVSVLGVVRSEGEGAITSLIVSEASGLCLESRDLSTAGHASLSDESSVQVLVEWAGRTWLRVGSALVHVDDGARTLRPVTTAVSLAASLTAFDSQRLYFVEKAAGAKIYAVPLDASASPSPVHTLGASTTPDTLALSAGRIVYRDTQHHWSSVPKEGGAATPVYTELKGASLRTAGPSLFFEELNESSLSSAISMNEDGTDVSLHTDVEDAMAWSFLASDSMILGSTRDQNPAYVFLVTTSGTGVKVTGYDASSREQLGSQTEIADHSLGMALAEGSGSTTLLATFANSGGDDIDVYSVDASRDGTPVAVAAHAGSADFFVGTSSCSTGAAGGLLAALLSVLSLARPFRRRARQ